MKRPLMFLLVFSLLFSQANTVYAAGQIVQENQGAIQSDYEEESPESDEGSSGSAEEESPGSTEEESPESDEGSSGSAEEESPGSTEGESPESEEESSGSTEEESSASAEEESSASEEESSASAEEESSASTEEPTEGTEEEQSDEPQIINNTITISVKNGENIACKLDLALKTAREHATDTGPITVKVPEGEYNLESNLHIYSNTILDVRGVTLKCICTQKNMLMSGTNGSYKGYADYNRSKACKGYGGFRNITVLGGTWIGNENSTSTLIRLAHAENVTLDGVTLQGGGCLHQSEVAAINGFYVKNCTFKNLKDQNTSSRQEALQLDIPCSESVFKAVYMDGTVMKNVEITGCTFSNVPRGVGTHTMVNGAYHENIRISGNTFRNVSQEAIVGLNYYNCEISGNTIENCGAGILFQYFKNSSASVYTTVFDGQTMYSGTIRHDAKTVIKNNSISIRYSSRCDEAQGIKVYGRKITGTAVGTDHKVIPPADYYISGVTVQDNVITTAGHGIRLVDARDCVISGNKINGGNVSANDPNRNNYNGIFVEKGPEKGNDHITIEYNTVSKISCDGIRVQIGAYADSVKKNYISEVGGNGICFRSKSGCSGKTAENTIIGCKKNAIKVDSYSKTGDITTNQIKTGSGGYAAEYGVYVYDHSSVNGSITKNSIEKTKKTPIFVSGSSSISRHIGSNRISSSGQYGIYVYDASTVKGNIEKNKIAKTKGNGIYISGKSVVKGSIISNTIDSAGGKGIYIYDKRNNASAGSIKNNVIRNSGSQAINLSAARNSLTISGNKLSGNTDSALVIQPGTTAYTVTVKDNIISSNKKKSAIRVISGKIVIKNNTISNAAYGIYANKGVKGYIYYNKFGKYTATQLRINRLCRKQTTAAAISRVKSYTRGKFTAGWKKVSNISGYELQYSTKKDFSSNVKTKTVKRSSTSLTLKGLKSRKTYYVRVRTYYTAGSIKIYSNYSTTKSVKVK
ncbi:MAG: right-handed parallel beta-helix repeat-containing protein [Lachnospiraceae bacterium]|nr:right-handed parallel beta-helix repeat-containing protein [Lachnospiraceae bacterium]